MRQRAEAASRRQAASEAAFCVGPVVKGRIHSGIVVATGAYGAGALRRTSVRPAALSLWV